MKLTALIGRLLGLDQTQAIHRVEPSLGAPWAHDCTAWLIFGCLALAILAILFYTRWQSPRRPAARVVLAALRAGLLVLLLVILAEPVLTVHFTNRLRPTFWLVFDGSESMALADDLAEQDRATLAAPSPGSRPPHLRTHPAPIRPVALAQA